MSMWMFLKIFSDSCVIFGILGAFPGGFPYSYSLLIPALLCGAGVGFAAFMQEHGRGGLRWLGLALPLCALLLAEGAEMLILIPVIGYAVLVILRRQFTLEYYSYRQYFLKSLILVFGLYLVLSMFSFLEGISESQIRTIYPDVTLRYGLVHLIVGVILQRQLRLGRDNHAQGSRLQIAGVLGSTGAVLGIFLIAEPVLRKGAAAVWNVLLSAVASVAILLNNLIDWFVNQVEFKAMQEQVEEHRANSDTPILGNVLQEVLQSAQQEPETESKWWVALVLIIVAVVMVMMLRTFRRKGSTPVNQEIVENIAAPQEGKIESRRTNRGKIRQYYREYLRMEKKRGLRLKKDMTTEDILQRITADTNPDAASELRQLYLLARYNEKSEITREQAEAAKAALKRSRDISN